MARFQSADRVPLFIVMSSSRARYGSMASPTSFRLSSEIPSGPTDLFFFSDFSYSFPDDFSINGK
jgi:hypothetical protein